MLGHDRIVVEGSYLYLEGGDSGKKEEAFLAIALLEEGWAAEERRINEQWKASEEWEPL